jgi:hypothetical protein
MLSIRKKVPMSVCEGCKYKADLKHTKSDNVWKCLHPGNRISYLIEKTSGRYYYINTCKGKFKE